MPSKVFNGTEASPFVIGNASGQAVGRIVLHVTAYTSGTLIPLARVTGSGATGVQVPYTNRNAPTTLVAAGTVINAVGLYEIDATGVDILFTDASFIGTIWWQPLEG